jgi:hypothetical protein
VYSWGFKTWIVELREVIKQADMKDILIFASGPNTLSSKQLPYPAEIHGVAQLVRPIVTVMQQHSQVAKLHSCFPESASPLYLSEDLKTDTKCLSGCSIATALAAGSAARILDCAVVCDIEPRDPIKSKHIDIIFQALVRQKKYVCPWEQSPTEGDSLTSWLRYPFFSKYGRKH